MQGHVSAWTKPPLGTLKFNVDAAFNPQHSSTRLGICVRDHNGHFVLAKTIFIIPLAATKEGEALALLEALRWLQDLQVDHVTFESDCKYMVDQLHSDEQDLTEFESILEHCRDILRVKPHYRVGFVKRQANNIVAHTLAGVAPFTACTCIFSTLPICITDIIFNEML